MLSVELDKLVRIADEAARSRGAAPGTPIVSVLSELPFPQRVTDNGTINKGNDFDYPSVRNLIRRAPNYAVPLLCRNKPDDGPQIDRLYVSRARVPGVCFE